jgi:prevent-host-death family protein
MNTLTVAELKRRGMAAIEEGLRRGPLHIVKRNRPAAVVMSEDEYQRLAHGKIAKPPGTTAVQWLLDQPTTGERSKVRIDLLDRRQRTIRTRRARRTGRIAKEAS